MFSRSGGPSDALLLNDGNEELQCKEVEAHRHERPRPLGELEKP